MPSIQLVALVTGATGVIGKAIAIELASDPDYKVVVLGRNRDRTEKTVAEIRKISGNDSVNFIIADVSRKRSVEKSADDWHDNLHVIVNAAGVAPRNRQVTPENIELTFATNVLGYLWVTEAFMPFMKNSGSARVINVASYWAGDLDIDDLEFKHRPYHNHPVYRQSKQANRMITVMQAEKMADFNIAVNACHPGDPTSKLSLNLGFGSEQTAEDAARTPVMLARGELGSTQTGCYFEHGKQKLCRFASDRENIEKLYRICGEYG